MPLKCKEAVGSGPIGLSLEQLLSARPNGKVQFRKGTALKAVCVHVIHLTGLQAPCCDRLWLAHFCIFKNSDSLGRLTGSVG